MQPSFILTVELRYTINQLPEAAARFLAACRGYRVFAFDASMGAGKTTFIHALCDQLGVTEPVSSPTFSLINEYETGEGELLYHLDLYRLRDEEEAIRAGVEDVLHSGAVCFVEWPQKAPSLLPPDTVWVHLNITGTQERLLRVRFPA
ncbi:MAG TPA: tRNA (adenosine(37)-N6)-threonylcarbamoyltransferase complex ATPase subunit type 1 TsaE [Lacibacter sp.]|nr:tRNA (adenosine(37)-N6)-threonylcarbamoyltransferase complex ATPase subunit type 1 TsaE [Lacibacter sp.]